MLFPEMMILSLAEENDLIVLKREAANQNIRWKLDCFLLYIVKYLNIRKKTVELL